MLDVVGIEARYGPVVALRGISLRVGAGEIVALIGANGAGKSTLTKVIAGIMAPAAGLITFNGRAIERAKPRQRIVAGLSLVADFYDFDREGKPSVGPLFDAHRPRRARQTRQRNVQSLPHSSRTP